MITTEIAKILDLDAKEYSSYDELVDSLEEKIIDNLPLVELPLAHRVTCGVYTREMVAPKGVLITSKPHNTNHQFIVSEGAILIYDERSNGWTKVTAPYHGITHAGTRRIGLVLEDVVWTTIHAVPSIEDREYDMEEFIELIGAIENTIIDSRVNPLLNTKNK